MLGTIDFVVFGFGALVVLFWLFLFVKGLRSASMFEPLAEKDFPLKEVYFVGYALLELIHYQYRSKRDRVLRKELTVLYGEKYADYYLRVIHSQQITFGLTVLALAAPLYGLGDNLALFIVMAVFAGVAYYYFGTLTAETIKKRSNEMLHDFSDVVSKLALMTNAGMILREAWSMVADTGTSTIYQEMKNSVIEMENGVSEVDAILNFGTRCIIPEIKKFASTMIQGMIKGNAELCENLTQQSKEIWGLRKQQVLRAGEKASSKLLIPLLIMFVGILIMIIIPIFANLGM